MLPQSYYDRSHCTSLKPEYLILWRFYEEESLNPGSEAELCHLLFQLFQLCRATRPLNWRMCRSSVLDNSGLAANCQSMNLPSRQ